MRKVHRSEGKSLVLFCPVLSEQSESAQGCGAMKNSTRYSQACSWEKPPDCNRAECHFVVVINPLSHYPKSTMHTLCFSGPCWEKKKNNADFFTVPRFPLHKGDIVQYPLILSDWGSLNSIKAIAWSSTFLLIVWVADRWYFEAIVKIWNVHVEAPVPTIQKDVKDWFASLCLFTCYPNSPLFLV